MFAAAPPLPRAFGPRVGRPAGDAGHTVPDAAPRMPTPLPPSVTPTGADHGIQSAASLQAGPFGICAPDLFVALALGLLISDARYRTLESIREVIGTGLFPLQRAALVPRDVGLAVADFFVTGTALHRENQTLKASNLQLALKSSQAQQLEAENAHLRALLELTRRSAIQNVPAEIAYDTRDPFTQKVIIDHGTSSASSPARRSSTRTV